MFGLFLGEEGLRIGISTNCFDDLEAILRAVSMRRDSSRTSNTLDALAASHGERGKEKEG